jgi:pimeloyl-ACP methyl ester carboxylesterase
MECKIRDLSVYYEIYGEGKPIIMIHGFQPDHRLIKGAMEPIFGKRDGYKRIYFDLPGMGRTKGADWTANSDMVLEIIIEFIDRIIPGQSFLLAGQSYGGYLSRGLICKMDDRIEGILMICPAVVMEAKRRNRPEHVVLKADYELMAGMTKEEAEEFGSMAVIQSKRNWERYRDEIMPGVILADNVFLEKLKNNYELSFDVDALKECFSKPALIITGRQDSSVGYSDAFKLLDIYPHASYAVLDMAGHNTHIEQEGLFCCLVNEWLDRINI